MSQLCCVSDIILNVSVLFRLRRYASPVSFWSWIKPSCAHPLLLVLLVFLLHSAADCRLSLGTSFEKDATNAVLDFTGDDADEMRRNKVRRVW